MGTLISKKTRSVTIPTENLKQGGFTVVKGIDETASVLSTDTVMHLKNLDVDTDGGLIIRKPIVCVDNVPEVYENDVLVSTNLCCTKRTFDKDYTLVLRTDSDKNSYLGVFKNNEPCTLQLVWNDWKEYAEHSLAITFDNFNFYKFPYVDFTHAHVSNTNTSTVITGGFVDIASEVFRREGIEYPTDTSTDLYFSKLYDFTNTGKVFKPRTFILTKSNDLAFDFTLKIVTPDVNVLNSADLLTLDPNLDLDNPYSIRDTYNTSAPTVKNIIAYVPTRTVRGTTEPLYEFSNTTSEPVSPSECFKNTAYTPDFTFNEEVFRTNPFRFRFATSTKSADITWGTIKDIGVVVVPNENVPLNYKVCSIEHSLTLTAWFVVVSPSNEYKHQALFRIGLSSTAEGGYTPYGTLLDTSTFDDFKNLKLARYLYKIELDNEVGKKYCSDTFYQSFQSISGNTLARIFNNYFSSGLENFSILYNSVQYLRRGVRTNINFGSGAVVYMVDSPIQDTSKLTGIKYSNTGTKHNYLSVTRPVIYENTYQTNTALCHKSVFSDSL